MIAKVLIISAIGVGGLGGVAISPVAPTPVRVYVKELIGLALAPEEAIASAKAKAINVRDTLRAAREQESSRQSDQAALVGRLAVYEEDVIKAKTKVAYVTDRLTVRQNKYDIGGTPKTRAEMESDLVRFERRAATAARHHAAIVAAAAANTKALADLRVGIDQREDTLLELGREIETAETLLQLRVAHAALTDVIARVRGFASIGNGESFVEQLRIDPVGEQGSADDYDRAIQGAKATN